MRRTVLGAALAALLAVGLGDRASVHANETTGLEGELTRVSAEVARLRGRSFVRNVPARTMTCGAASARLLEIARAEGARCSPDIERAVIALGFVGRGLTPTSKNERADQGEEETGQPCGLAFYDQIRKEVVVVEGRSTPDERAEVLAHELSHALQDQLFDLRSRLRTMTRTASGDHDAEELAVNAAINEGEATVIELLHLWNGGADRSWIQGIELTDPIVDASRMLGATWAPRDRAARTGAAMRSILRGARIAWERQRRPGSRCYFPSLARFQYLVGCTFVAEAWRRGGWEAVDRLRDSPPTSTSQLLHPDLYFDAPERPARVPASPLLSDWKGRARLLYENRLGELGTSVAIEGEAKGWRGDDFRVLGRATDGSALVEARFLWEDPGSALLFMARAAHWLATMNLPIGTFDVVERRGSAVVIGAGIREDELASFRASSFRVRDKDDLSAAAASMTSTADRTLGVRRRGPDGRATCELRVLEPAERDKALDVLKAHTDRGLHGTIDTDGRSWGLRSRPGGGVSWVEERPDGRILVATGDDRAAIEATRAAISRLAPLPSRSADPGEALELEKP